MSETYATYRVWDGCKAPINLEYNGRLIGQIARESTIDRDALLELADECGDASRAYAGDGHELTSRQFANVSRRIREVLGVDDGD